MAAQVPGWDYFAALAAPVVLIGAYGKYRCDHPTYKDPLERECALLGLDGWSATHAVFFFVLGFLYPQHFLLSVLAGVAWELFEGLAGRMRPGFLGGYGDCPGLASDRDATGWWYAKPSDVLINGLFCALGVYVATGGPPRLRLSWTK